MDALYQEGNIIYETDENGEIVMETVSYMVLSLSDGTEQGQKEPQLRAE